MNELIAANTRTLRCFETVDGGENFEVFFARMTESIIVVIVGVRLRLWIISSWVLTASAWLDSLKVFSGTSNKANGILWISNVFRGRFGSWKL